MPKHGEERNKKLVTQCGKSETLMVGDRVVYEGPLHFYQYTQSEKYCKVCGEWVTIKGILEAIACPQCKTVW